ncbi:MAG: hypothetical protein K6D59_01615 [Bacteroidales bacterium]|nr:hypothetical protein [Bacteroidales bacterium]
MDDKRYQIELEVLTPLAIGAGSEKDWAKGIDFIQQDGKVYVLDLQKMISHGVDIDKLTSLFLRDDVNGISQLLGGDLTRNAKLVFDCLVETQNSIKTFQRTQLLGRPLIAGSSLKGAIRSILFKHLRDDRDEKDDYVFGVIKDGKNFMRFLQVGDIVVSNTCLVNTKIFNLQTVDNQWRGGWKHAFRLTNSKYDPIGFNTIYECAEPGQKGIGSISLTENRFQMSLKAMKKAGEFIRYEEKKTEVMQGGLSFLFRIINRHTREYLSKEREFFCTYPTDRSEELVNCIDELLQLIPADDSYCVLKMSAGSGFHSITGDWQYPDYTDIYINGVRKFKSRKTAEYQGRLCLMGFVKLCQLS